MVFISFIGRQQSTPIFINNLSYSIHLGQYLKYLQRLFFGFQLHLQIQYLFCKPNGQRIHLGLQLFNYFLMLFQQPFLILQFSNQLNKRTSFNLKNQPSQLLNYCYNYYQFMSLKWTSIKDSYKGPSRQGHTLTYISSINCLLLNGGVSSQKDNKIYLYDIANSQWRVQQTEGRKHYRRYHCAVYDQTQNVLIVHGGEQKGQSSEQWLVLFIEGWKWKRIFLQKYPPSRQNHTLNIWKKDLVLFGGISMPYKTYLNDIWILESLNGLKPTASNEIYNGMKCTQILAKGEGPMPRHSHKCHIVKDNLFLLGGQAQSVQSMFTCYVLNLTKKIWEKVLIEKNPLRQLSNFEIIQSKNESEILILGGNFLQEKKLNKLVVKLNLSSFHIQNIQSERIAPCLLNMSSCSVVNFKKQVQTFLMGWNDSKLQFYSLSQGYKEKTNKMDIPLEEYLISIKNEQILSQELIKKNNHLQQLYLTIQKYISQLHQDYIFLDQYNEKVQSQKQKHIHYSLQLKQNYGKIQQLYKDATQSIKKARNQLSDINEQFGKCIETQLDQEQ